MEKTINEMKVLLDAVSSNEAVSRSVVTAFLMQTDPSVGELADIKTAVSEAVTNAIVHGYRHKKGKVELICRIYRDGVFYIKVKDRGCGIADIKKAMEPLFTTAPQEERAGLGFAVMESFMDSVSVRSAPGKGTSVIMKKRLSLGAQDPIRPHESRSEAAENECC